MSVADSLFDNLVQTDECTAADEQDIARVDFDKFLVGMFPPTVRREPADRPLDNLEECLLHAFSRDIPRQGHILGLGGEFVTLVDPDDRPLRPLHIIPRTVVGISNNVLHILANVASFGQSRRVRDGKGNIQHLRDGLGEQGLATAGRTNHQHVGLLNFHVSQFLEVILGQTVSLGVVAVLRCETAVVVVHRDSNGLL